MRLNGGDKAPYTGFLVPRENWRLYQNYADENEALQTQIRNMELMIDKHADDTPNWIYYSLTFAMGVMLGSFIPHR